MSEMFEIKECKLTKTEKWLDSHLVVYPVSYKYNGGIVLDKKGHVCFKNGKWYAGFKVPKPIAPKGFKLVDIGVGLNLNAYPPMKTAYLKPINA